MKLSFNFADTKLFYFLIFFIFGLIFFAHYATAGQAVYGDGIEYYAWLHSIYFDHDINFKNEFKHIYNYEYNNNFPSASDRNNPPLTKAGKVGDFHMPGMALLLFPFYFLADSIVIILNLIGIQILRNGYSNIYQVVSGLGAVCYATLGIYFTEKTLTFILSKIKFIRTNLIRVSVMLTVLASPLLYYLSLDVLNSHFGTFFVVSLFYYILFVKSDNKFKFLLLGLFIGLATWVRVQDAALFIPLLVKLAFDYHQKVNFKQLLTSFLITAIAFSLTLTPLLFTWQYLYGSVLSHPYIVGLLSASHFSLLGSLFDPANGLFTKTPLLLFLLLFIPLAYRKTNKELIVFLSFFIVQIYGIERYGGWPAASFGGRMYISSMPLFFLLSGMLVYKIKNNLLIIITLFFIGLNLLNIFNFMAFQKQASGGTRGLEEGTKLNIEKILNHF